jgi:RHH-type transcriptional regulator, proline utilization regulon repressor / proline dehydrogenase / delta 1-pyrroline-5-carboxylate dehydrogenase
MDLVFPDPPPSEMKLSETPLRAVIRDSNRRDETAAVSHILAAAELPPEATERIDATARTLVEAVRRQRFGKGGLDAFLQEYALSSPEGVALMCLAEALLRIPDAETVDRLIRDKIAPETNTVDWQRHLGHSGSLFVNASTWALMLTGRLLRPDHHSDLASALRHIIARSSEPLWRQAVTAAMRILADQFISGRTIEEALRRIRDAEQHGYRHSFDMLGEAARTGADAERYREAYRHAIAALGNASAGRVIEAAPGISIKLSALHPRYEMAQRDRVMRELLPSLFGLAAEARDAGIGFTIDAEEADRLELSLDLIEALAMAPELAGWDGLGLAVQAYQKRALALVDWLADLAGRAHRRLMLRLVKGAYWDSEIKRAQERGLDSYPVFTRKVATDVSYLACVKRMLAAGSAFFPQFATHNAHTVAIVLELAGGRTDWEFQRLHGMGEALYDQIVGPGTGDRRTVDSGQRHRPCRVYAPVGGHEDLLAYLVRRLLENGANTSFVNRIVDAAAPIDAIVADPIAALASLPAKPHPRIPLPRDLFLPTHRNSPGIDFGDPRALSALQSQLSMAGGVPQHAGPLVGGVEFTADGVPARDPTDHRRRLSKVAVATPAMLEKALSLAAAAAPQWDATPAERRAAVLDRAADRFEAHRAELMALIIREGGRTIPAAMSEVREACDLLRYYGGRARADFAAPQTLSGPTGERNELSLHGRGVFACISPWNFPLAIFTGQVAAALAAGNAVIAKPAEQTPVIAAAAVHHLLAAGIPSEVLHLLPGPGEQIGAALVADPRIAGVAFTGSTETAQAINRALAGRDGPIVPLIAETGGQNAMIVDSSALPEQIIADVVTSAFDSAGQRCSALRLLYLQQEIAERVISMLAGAMAELRIGDPALLATDVGPVIDAEARRLLQAHAARMERTGHLIYQCPLPPETAHGTFFAPRAFEIESARSLNGEIFGPILHIVRWSADRLDAVIDEIAATGYALTLGIQSRIDETMRHVLDRLGVGNNYVNRNMIGAVVGAQPFGGERLSGTGPKAGGPRYLHRFATERTLSVDTTAAGGNATLLSLADG